MLPNQKIRVLVVDDDPAMAKFLINHLLRKNFDVSSAATGEEAIRMFRVYDPALVLLDVNTAGMTGIETLERLKQIKPDVSVIMLSTQQDPDFIFKASKLGADDYIGKPFEPKDLDQRMARVLERERQVNEVSQLRDQVRRQSDFSMLFGTSPKMEEVKMTVEQVADTNVTVLIRGESGAGKEVVARMVYGNSTRRDKPFVKVNCAAIPSELLESELFGYEPGAFTGANRQKLGKFEQANYGTIFLDEISEMHPALQAKLLHVLQDGEFARLGGKRDISVDVRVLAATNKPLERAVGSRDSSGRMVPMTQPTVESAFQSTANGPLEMPSLLEIGRRAAMQAEREAIERVLAQTRWNRRQAAKILRVSYKALLNKLKAMEEGKVVKAAAEEPKVNSRQQPA